MGYLSPPRLTNPTGPPGNQILGNAQGVIQSVNNAANATYCTVLVNNQFPAISGYALPANVPPFGIGGGTGFSAYYNNAEGVGGSYCIVDQDTKTVLTILPNVSTAAPTPKYAILPSHLHIGNLTPNSPTNPVPININPGSPLGNWPYYATSDALFGPVTNRSANVIATEFGGDFTHITSGAYSGYYLQNTGTVTDAAGYGLPAGAWYFMDWWTNLNDAVDSTVLYGPSITDGVTTYEVQFSATTPPTLYKNGTAVSAAANSFALTVATDHQIVFGINYAGGTTYLIALWVDGVLAMKYIDGGASLQTVVYPGFYSASTTLLYHKTFDFYGYVEDVRALVNPTTAAPVLTGTPTVAYLPSTAGNFIIQCDYTFTDSPTPVWASAARMYWTSTGGALNQTSASYTDIPVNAANTYKSLALVATGTSYDLYGCYVDDTGNYSTPVLLFTGTNASPSTSGTAGASGVNPSLTAFPALLSYVEDNNAGTFSCFTTIDVDANGKSTNTWLTDIEYVTSVTGLATWTASARQTPNSSGTYIAGWFDMEQGTQYDVGIRYVDGTGVDSNVLIIFTTPINPPIVLDPVNNGNVPVAPAYNPADTVLTPYASLEGSLQDINCAIQLTNVPQDQSVDTLAWYFRRSYHNAPQPVQQVVTLQNNDFGSYSSQMYGVIYDTSNQPTVGNLVVLCMGVSTASWITQGDCVNNWILIPGSVHDVSGGSGYGGTAAFYKFWTLADAAMLTQEVCGTHGELAGVCWATEFVGSTVDPNLPIQTAAHGDALSLTQNLSINVPNINSIVIGLVGNGDGATSYGQGIGTVSTTNNFLQGQPGQLDGAYYNEYMFKGFSLQSQATTTTNETVTSTLTLSAAYQIMSTVLDNLWLAVVVNPVLTPFVYSLYSETGLSGAPSPPESQFAEFSYGQVTAGIAYDFACAYISTQGIFGPLAPFALAYVGNPLGIPTAYLLNGSAFTPVISAGIPANSGTPNYASPQPPYVITDVGNLLSTDIEVSMQFLNQPLNGSLSRVAFWYRTAVPSPATVTTGWSYYGSIPAVGLGLTISQLPLIGNYIFNFADLSNANNYDFGISAEDTQGDETDIIYLETVATSTATPPTGNANLVPASLFEGSTFVTGSGGWSHDKVSASNPYWYFHNIDPSLASFVIDSPGGKEATVLGVHLASTIAGSAITEYGISSPIIAVAGQEYAFSARINAAQVTGGGTVGGSAGILCAIVDSTGANTYTTIYASAHQTNGVNGVVNGTWTCPGGWTTGDAVAFMLHNNGVTISSGGYYHMGQPMMVVGVSSTGGFTPGPTTPSTMTTSGIFAQGLTVGNAGGSGNADAVATMPTVTSGAAAPTSGGAAPIYDQQPQGSLRISTADTGGAQTVFAQTSATSSSPAWLALANTVIFDTSFPSSPTSGTWVYRTDLEVSYVYNTGTAEWQVIATAGTGSSFPSSPVSGQMFYRTDVQVFYTYNSGIWEEIGGPGVSTLVALTDISFTYGYSPGSFLGYGQNVATLNQPVATFSSNSATTGTATLLNPPAVGHTMLLVVDVATLQTPPAVSGWTLYQEPTLAYSNYAVYWKYSTGATDQSVTVSYSSSSFAQIGIALIETTGTAAPTGLVQATNVGPTISSVPAGAFLFGTFCGGSGTGSVLSGWTETQLLYGSTLAYQYYTNLTGGASFTPESAITGASSATNGNAVFYVPASGTAVFNFQGPVIVASAFPSGTPATAPGTLCYRTDLHVLYVYNNSSVWQPAATIGNGTSDPTGYAGMLYYRSDLSALRLYYSGSWITVASNTVNIGTGTSFPGSPSTGELFYRTDLLQTYVYNGAAWALSNIPTTSTTAGYVVPAVLSSGTLSVLSTGLFAINQYIQINGGATPFIGQITAIGSSTSMTVETVVTGSASTISSGAIVSFGGGGGGGGGVSSITGPGGTETGGLTFNGPAVSNSSTTFRFNSGLAFGTSFPGTPSSGDIFYRTDLFALYQYTGSAWETSATISSGTTDPTVPTPIKGELFYNTTSNTLRYYTGSSWSSIGGASAGVSQITGPGGTETGNLTFTGCTNSGVAFTWTLAALADLSTTGQLPGYVVTYNGGVVEKLQEIYGGSTATTLTTTLPTAPLVGSLLVAEMSTATAAGGTITTPTGWTQVHSYTSGYYGQTFVYTKTSVGVADQTVAWVSGRNVVGGVIEYGNAGTPTGFSDNYNSTTTGTIASIPAGSYGRAVFACEQGASSATPGAGWTVDGFFLYGSAAANITSAAMQGSFFATTTASVSTTNTVNTTGGPNTIYYIPPATGINYALSPTVGATAGTAFPSDPQAGTLCYRTDLTTMYVYTGSAWVYESSTTVGSSTPASPAPIAGELFFNTSTDILYVYSGSSWIAIGAVVVVATGTSYPVSPVTGQLFYRTDLTALEIWNGTTWIAANSGGGGGGGTFTLGSSAYTIPPVGVAGTMGLSTAFGGTFPCYIQVAGANGGLPFVGEVTGGSGANITVITQQIGGANPLAAASTGAYSGSVGSTIQVGSSFDQTVLRTAGLTNYYPMNETSGTTVYDVKGGANGTYSGSPLLAAYPTNVDNLPIFNGSSRYATLTDNTTSSVLFQSSSLQF